MPTATQSVLPTQSALPTEPEPSITQVATGSASSPTSSPLYQYTPTSGATQPVVNPPTAPATSTVTVTPSATPTPSPSSTRSPTPSSTPTAPASQVPTNRPTNNTEFPTFPTFIDDGLTDFLSSPATVATVGVTMVAVGAGGLCMIRRIGIPRL